LGIVRGLTAAYIQAHAVAWEVESKKTIELGLDPALLCAVIIVLP
jgi:hypothetical protein